MRQSWHSMCCTRCKGGGTRRDRAACLFNWAFRGRRWPALHVHPPILARRRFKETGRGGLGGCLRSSALFEWLSALQGAEGWLVTTAALVLCGAAEGLA